VDQILSVKWRSSTAAHRHSSNVRGLSKSIYVGAKSNGATANLFCFSERALSLSCKQGSRALAEDFIEMNARREIRDALLVRRMKYWRDIAKCPLVTYVASEKTLLGASEKA
jgi:hypothetical protein